jgi:ATP-binding cassette, subfamily B, bacterial
VSPEHPAERRRLVRRIVSLFSPYRGRTALILVSIVVTSALGIVNPLLIQVVFDDALFVEGGPKLGLLYALVAVMVAIPLVLGALGVAQTYLTNWVGNRVMQDLRDRLYAHLQSMPLAFFTGTRTGETSRASPTTWAASRPWSPAPRRRSSRTS